MLPLKLNIFPAMLAMLALLQPALAAAVSEGALDSRADGVSRRGAGLLLDWCDPDWTVTPEYYFLGRCGETPETREWHHIDLPNCYTVTDNGVLAIDNWRVGGMEDKCDRCSRCTDSKIAGCFVCRCAKKDASMVWTTADLDGTVFWDGVHRGNRKHVCCGEWWGGPYCGEAGPLPEPILPSIELYLLDEGVN